MSKILIVVQDNVLKEIEATLHPHPFNKKSKLAVHKNIVDSSLTKEDEWVVTDTLYGVTINRKGLPKAKALPAALAKLKKTGRKVYKVATEHLKTIAEHKLKELYGKDKG